MMEQDENEASKVLSSDPKLEKLPKNSVIKVNNILMHFLMKIKINAKQPMMNKMSKI